jgi:hypothetical protein
MSACCRQQASTDTAVERRAAAQMYDRGEPNAGQSLYTHCRMPIASKDSLRLTKAIRRTTKTDTPKQPLLACTHARRHAGTRTTTTTTAHNHRHMCLSPLGALNHGYSHICSTHVGKLAHVYHATAHAAKRPPQSTTRHHIERYVGHPPQQKRYPQQKKKNDAEKHLWGRNPSGKTNALMGWMGQMAVKDGG